MKESALAWRRCGHCKHLTPEYKKLGEAVAASPKLKDRVVIAKVRPKSSLFCLPSGVFVMKAGPTCISLSCLLRHSKVKFLHCRLAQSSLLAQPSLA